MCVHWCTHVQTHMDMHTHMHAHIYTWTHVHTCTHHTFAHMYTYMKCMLKLQDLKTHGKQNQWGHEYYGNKVLTVLSFHLYDDLESENQISFISSHSLYFFRSEIVNQLIGNVDKSDSFIDTNGLFYFLNKCYPLPHFYIAMIRKRYSRYAVMQEDLS